MKKRVHYAESERWIFHFPFPTSRYWECP